MFFSFVIQQLHNGFIYTQKNYFSYVLYMYMYIHTTVKKTASCWSKYSDTCVCMCMCACVLHTYNWHVHTQHTQLMGWLCQLLHLPLWDENQSSQTHTHYHRPTVTCTCIAELSQCSFFFGKKLSQVLCCVVLLCVALSFFLSFSLSECLSIHMHTCPH